MLDQNTFSNWLEMYGNAWETLDPNAIIKIFSEDALYYETPFSSPFIGRKGIHEYWTNNAQATQKNVNFGYDQATLSDNTGLAHWWATFTIIETGKRIQIDGFLLAEFNDNSECTCFREWWHADEES